ncbi:hypothetical protein JCM5296_006878 [Sporobolomyces johnsonii]
MAQAARSLASSSQSPLTLSDLQAKPLELVRTWCTALKAVNVPAEDKEQILRTLRVSRLPEGHEQILRDVTPLLLDPSLRLQAAGCLIQYTSAASIPTLHDHLTLLTSTIIRALSPLRHTVHSASAPSSLSRFVSTCLRILNAIALKLSALPQDIVDSVVATLGLWAYHRPGSVGTASPAPDRGRGAGQGQLAFGVMSAFAQPPDSPRKGNPSSMPSSRSSSVGRQGLSESEDESGPRDRRVDFAQIRLDALTCLRSLATNDPKALHKEWHLFLSDSPYLRNRPTLVNLIESDSSRSVRLQACAALEAMLKDSASYLAIAQDRPTKASFTSLSTKIGETVSELHLSLASILTAPIAAGQAELRLASLRLATTLASNSPYGRLKRPLARLLARAILPSLASPDSSHVLHAVAALKAVVDRYVSTSSSQPFEWTDLISITTSIASQHPSENVQAASSSLLASTVPAALDYDWSPLLRRLASTLSTAPAPVQTAQTAFLAAFFRPAPPNPSQPAASLAPSLLAQLTPLLSQALFSSCPAVRAIATEALVHPALRRTESDLDCWTEALRLAEDEDLTVCTSAFRVVGVLLKADEGQAVDRRKVRGALSVLSRRFEEDEDRSSDVSWALANCCDVLSASDLDSVNPIPLVMRALKLLHSDSTDEKTRISALRILGSLLKLSALSRLPDEDALPDGVLEAFEHALRDGAAKVRWNAATAISNALSSPSAVASSPVAFSSVFDRLLTLISDDPSFKVRIHAVSALLAVFQQPLLQGSEAGRAAPAAVEARQLLARQLEDGAVPAKERRHAEVLMKRLGALVARLDELSQTSSAA